MPIPKRLAPVLRARKAVVTDTEHMSLSPHPLGHLTYGLRQAGGRFPRGRRHTLPRDPATKPSRVPQ